MQQMIFSFTFHYILSTFLQVFPSRDPPVEGSCDTEMNVFIREYIEKSCSKYATDRLP